MNHNNKLASEIDLLAQAFAARGETQAAAALKACANIVRRPSLGQRLKAWCNINNPIKGFQIAKNTSWSRSLLIGWVIIPFWLPTVALAAFVQPLIAITAGVCAILFNLFVVVASYLAAIVAAPLGFASESDHKP